MVIRISKRWSLRERMSSVVQATHPYPIPSSVTLEVGLVARDPLARVVMSWTPAAKSGRRRAGRGSSGKTSETPTGIPERTEISYTNLLILAYVRDM